MGKKEKLHELSKRIKNSKENGQRERNLISSSVHKG